MTLEGKVAIVTGASRGIGEYISLHLARAGAAVAVAARTVEVTDKRLPGTIHTVVDQIRSEGGRAVAIRVDVRQAESIAECVQKTVDEFGRVDIVVNNAAILVPGSLDTVAPRHLDLIWQIDLRGPILMMREALPYIKQAGGGHLLNISSAGAIFPGPGPYANPRSGGVFYSMAKAGLERLSQGLAMELQPDNVAVNVLSPTGRIRTPGNIWAENDPLNPSLEFEGADKMGAAAVWICEHPPSEYTGNILFDDAVCAENGLLGVTS